jgi:hypothetical protein
VIYHHHLTPYSCLDDDDDDDDGDDDDLCNAMHDVPLSSSLEVVKCIRLQEDELRTTGRRACLGTAIVAKNTRNTR